MPVIFFRDEPAGRQEEPLQNVIEIGAADRVFVLTSAGISAESGLATFRGAGGLWRDHRLEEVASPQAWRRDPVTVWEFYSQRRRAALTAQPNPGHLALARLGDILGHRLFLCTQNVDDLHERAGSRGVAHMHGDLFKSRCDTCDRAPFADTHAYEPPDGIPYCGCGGWIRPHICWFGEMPYEMDRIARALGECTLFLAVGTSGVVEPAASFAAQARARARTIYIGPEEPANRLAFAECHGGKAGELLPGLLRCAGSGRTATG